jgi:hypothetical protein
MSEERCLRRWGQAGAAHPEAANNTDDADLQALAQYPWNQRWKSRPSLSLSMLGRALRVGLTFCNEQCTGQITTLVHLGLKKDQNTIYTEFSAAALGDAGEVASALCIILRAMSYASSRAKAVLQDAEQQAQAHPSSSLLAFAVLGRRVQEATLGRFLDEVVKRITTDSEAGAAHSATATTCTILMYQEFLWRPFSRTRFVTTSSYGGDSTHRQVLIVHSAA